jgi:hypothetical protein
MRMRFIFKLFDPDNSDECDRLEFRNIVTSFIEMIIHCKFDSEYIQSKINDLNNEITRKDSNMEKVLDGFVDDVYGGFSYSGEILTYDEWTKWFYSINAIDKVLDFSGSLKIVS